MLSRLRRRAGRGDAGVSLAETLVAAAVSTVALAIALSFFVWVGRSTQAAADNSFTTDGVRLAVSSMATTLRFADTPTSVPGATDFRVISPLSHTTISFFANVNGNRAGAAARSLPTRVTYTFANGAITEARYQPKTGAVAQPSTWTSNYPTTPTSTRTLVRGVASMRLDYDVLSTSGSTNGTLVRVQDSDLTGSSTAANVACVTVTVTSAATTDRPAQTFTATAVLTGSTS